MQPKLLIRDGHGQIWMNDVKCLGSERKLQNCIYNDDRSHCRHSEDVGIHCFINCSTEDHENEGIVLVKINVRSNSSMTVILIYFLYIQLSYSLMCCTNLTIRLPITKKIYFFLHFEIVCCSANHLYLEIVY